MAREHTAAALDTIKLVMSDPLAEHKDRLRAAEQILDRGHGKPLSATIQLPTSRRAALAMAQLSDEELMERINAVPLPRLARGGHEGETFDAEPQPEALAMDPLLA
jgi:hypothetical protein